MPDLQRCLFSITRFADSDHYVVIRKNAAILHFGEDGTPVTLPMENELTMASCAKQKKREAVPPTVVPEVGTRDAKNKRMKVLPLELIHCRLGLRSCWSLVAASESEVWQDVKIRLEPEPKMLTVGLATLRAALWPIHLLLGVRRHYLWAFCPSYSVQVSQRMSHLKRI